MVDEARAYPGTTRSVWVHVPVSAQADEKLRCMVFQDGGGYLDPDDDIRGGIVLDNLIAAGAIPPMVGIFVDPGLFPEVEDPRERKNRNAEYDAFDSRYADFLIDEVLPLVGKAAPISDDPKDRGLCGHSSGGNAALTAAWHRPDAFGKVIGFVSSFAQMPGGNPYPRLIPAEPARTIRIFLQAAHRDLAWNEPDFNWLAENLKVAAALAQGGYDFRLVLGDGEHNTNHAGVLMPDALRWLWRD
ncbi:MAG: alpha/beta hydrolase-fold protein [Nocardioides sp.]